MSKTQTKSSPLTIFLLTAITIGLLVYIFTTATNVSPTPPITPSTPPITPSTPIPDLETWILSRVPGIESVPVANTSAVEAGGSQTLIEVITTPLYNNEDTATRIFALGLEEVNRKYDVPAPIYFSLIIDDGTVKTVYEHDRDTQSFVIKNLE